MAFPGAFGPDDLMPQPLLPELSRALEGAVFPLTRGELIQVARENEAPDMLLTLLEGAPERIYRDLPSLERAIAHEPVEGSVEAPLSDR